MAHVDDYNEDWEKDAPLLSSMKRKQPYEAPEGYFDALPGALMDRIRDLDVPAESDRSVTDPEPVPTGRTWRMSPRSYSVAAMIAILSAVGIYFLVKSIDVPVGPQTEQIVAVESVEESPFDEDELLSQIDLSLVSDEEIVDMMGDEALAAWEMDQLGQDLNLNFDALDLYDVDMDEIDELEELDELDLDGLDGLDLEGIEDLLY